ncbi:DctM7 [Desulforapulum autotrophicum HRM2]|uniref:DctM7 n=1 Tax=Desulforapulum autotrophicum (strain ATCC 43914 / DSM 3382 / VKM B-1955 / HRM2) TaxID=177437 RepID=C0QBC8_DESAH|nr:TRAP transporter large permease subunit [Desulforapulum autotrophicum]ACN16930.1 DctM7 [Desulforapulum autotrophicum HRM2]
MNPALVVVVMFLAVVVLFILRTPVAFTLGAVGILSLLMINGPRFLMLLPPSILENMSSIILLAIPLFIFIGCMLEKSGIADEIFEMIYKWLGPIPGGLAIGTVFICVIFAAMVGVVGAATVTMGLIALPAMLKRGYKTTLAIGCISGGGALGFLIPPSVTMIVYASLSNLSIGKMFLAGVLPGFMLAGLFMGYILIRSLINPSLAPPVPKEERATWAEKFLCIKNLAMPFVLIFSIMGTIFSGMATPTEAAAVGAFVSILIVVARVRSVKGVAKIISTAAEKTAYLTSMVLWIIIGCLAFSAVVNTLGLPSLLNDFIESLGINRWVVLIAMQLSFFFLGMVMDDLPIIMITVPIYVPLISLLGFDPLWFGILFIVNMQMAYLTPPFGFVLFYMRGVVPANISMGQIYKSVWPFIGLQFLCLLLIMLFPEIVLWLPSIVGM